MRGYTCIITLNRYYVFMLMFFITWDFKIELELRNEIVRILAIILQVRRWTGVRNINFFTKLTPYNIEV